MAGNQGWCLSGWALWSVMVGVGRCEGVRGLVEDEEWWEMDHAEMDHAPSVRKRK